MWSPVPPLRALRQAWRALPPVFLALAALGAPASAMPGKLWGPDPTHYSPKDFSILRDGTGAYHALYILTNRAAGLNFHDTEYLFGHSWSQDLVHWRFVDSSFTVRSDGADRDHVWAPSLVRAAGDTTWMLYTGVTDTLVQVSPPVWDVRFQTTGLAWSSDLQHWSRTAGPVWTSPLAGWSLYRPDLHNGDDFRDPFVMRDIPRAGVAPRWLMYFTTHYADEQLPAGVTDPDHNTYVLGVAASDGDDLSRWNDLGPIASTYRTTYAYEGLTVGSDVIESPHLFDHDGVWYLVFTPDPTKHLVVMTAADPLGPFTYWGTLDEMIGRDTTPWFATELLRERFEDGEADDYFGCVSDEGGLRHIEFRQVRWGAPGAFTLIDPLQVQQLTWPVASVTEGRNATLNFQLMSPDTLGRTVHLEVYELAGTTRRRVPPGRVGLPDAVPVRWTGTYLNNYPVTSFVFPTRLDPDDGDTDPLSTRVIVRWHGVESAALRIMAANEGGGSRWNDGLGGPEPGATGLALAAGPRGAPALRVTLAEAGHARLDLYDVAGHRVRRLLDRTLTRGVTLVGWDGRDARGARAAAGVYFARLETPAGARSARLLLVP